MASAPEPTRAKSHWADPRFGRGFSVQMRVIGALMARELQTRYGRHNIGYLWVIAEPMMLATVVGVLHQASDLGMHAKGMSPFAFTLLGYTVFILFRNIFNRADHVLDTSSNLLLHRIIKPFDIILSRALVEIAGVLCALAIMVAVGKAIGLADFPVRPLYLLFAIGLMSWLSLGMAIMVAAYTYESHLLSRFVHPFSYFMMPLSGAFFTVNFLPEWARDFMLWNPMVTIFEIARYGMFEVASDRYLYPGYAAGFAAACTYIGLVALRRVERHIHVS